MSLFDLFVRDAEIASLKDAVPGDNVTGKIASHAQELATLEARIERVDALREAMQTRHTRLSQRVLPELMDSVGVDRIGVPGAESDLVVQPYYKANIPVGWPDDQREAAFRHLDELGGSALPQATLAIAFEREQLPIARRLAEAISIWLQKAKVQPEVSLDVRVNWQRLTGFVKTYMEQPVDPHAATNQIPIDLECLGATAGRVCKIVKRKAQKSARRKK